METGQPEKLDLRSHDPAEQRWLDLLRLFPEIRTEGGKLDFERLRLALGEAVTMVFLISSRNNLLPGGVVGSTTGGCGNSAMRTERGSLRGCTSTRWPANP